MTFPYPPGMIVALYADIPNATLTPLPDGVPTGTKLRAVVTQNALTVLWQQPDGEIGRLDFPMTDEQIALVDYTGGQVGPYSLTRGGGCSSCGSARLSQELPFPNVNYVQRMPPGQVYGVPPQRWERP